ncbi:CfrBI family restriction endonuclease [Candidatus Sumerlaeota bacterium]|nr:CfrBI family restriction endonuclease [Candidatus Sumerlaeota bacterium]
MKKTKLNSSCIKDLLSSETLKLLSATGKDLVKQVGFEVIRGVVFDVLTGKNLRDSTETLTRRRIVQLNLATVNFFLNGASKYEDFVNKLPYMIENILRGKGINKSEKWLGQWILGLTDKAFQNVLRDDPLSLARYRDKYIETCKEVMEQHQKSYGELTGTLQIGSNIKAEISWLLMVYLLNTIGAQTLAVRGSEKSSYGKLFEKLILGSLLHILGFKYVAPPLRKFKKVFWLSSREEKRESDATLLYEKGKGVRFDIGFIGKGNPEISLDKVTRFEREISLGRSLWYMATIILVDRIGANSRIERLARDVKGTIIQMSASYWPKQVAQELNKSIGFKHILLSMNPSEIEEYLKKELNKVPLGKFIGLDESDI